MDEKLLEAIDLIIENYEDEESVPKKVEVLVRAHSMVTAGIKDATGPLTSRKETIRQLISDIMEETGVKNFNDDIDGKAYMRAGSPPKARYDGKLLEKYFQSEDTPATARRILKLARSMSDGTQETLVIGG